MTDAAPFPPIDGSQPCASEPDLFFPKTSRASHFQRPRAVALCESCPFRRPCLAYALTNDVIGIWGGTAYMERQRIREKHGITAKPIDLTFTDLVEPNDLESA
jgi:hypothetical protein